MGVSVWFAKDIDAVDVRLEKKPTFLHRNSSNTQPLIETFTTPPAVTGSMQLNASNNWLASARGRFGWANNNLLLYGTGGAAFTDTRYSALMTPGPANGIGLSTPGGITVPLAANFSQDQVGWVLGAGLEWMAAPNWLLRAEYLYYHFDGTAGVLPVSTTGPGGGVCTGCGWNINSSSLQISTVRAGISYKFSGPITIGY